MGTIWVWTNSIKPKEPARWCEKKSQGKGRAVGKNLKATIREKKKRSRLSNPRLHTGRGRRKCLIMGREGKREEGGLKS